MMNFIDVLTLKVNALDYLAEKAVKVKANIATSQFAENIREELYASGVTSKVPPTNQELLQNILGANAFNMQQQETVMDVPNRVFDNRHETTVTERVNREVATNIKPVAKAKALPTVKTVSEETKESIIKLKKVLYDIGIDDARIDTKLGTRSDSVSIFVTKTSSIKKLLQKSNIDIIEYTTQGVITEGKGCLILTLTREEFTPLYLDNYLHMLKKRGDIVLGEVNGEIKIVNLFGDAPHAFISGASRSGKSFFSMAVIKSLLQTSPNTILYCVSPKLDAFGGDFRVFSEEAHRLLIIGAGGQETLLQDVLTITNEIVSVINYRTEHIEGEHRDILLAIDEMTLLIEEESVPKSGEAREYAIERNSLRGAIMNNLKIISNAGASHGIRMVLATQSVRKSIFGGAFLANFTRTAFKSMRGEGVLTGFGSIPEKLKPHGDGITSHNGEWVRFQAPLFTGVK